VTCLQFFCDAKLGEIRSVHLTSFFVLCQFLKEKTFSNTTPNLDVLQGTFFLLKIETVA
jgi:hypothetical protein